MQKEVNISINYNVIKEILKQVDKVSPLGIEDETKINIEEADISKEEKRAYLDWLATEGYVNFHVFGESKDNPKGTAQNIIITEKGIDRLRG
jgi:hypothetical protein